MIKSRRRTTQVIPVSRATTNKTSWRWRLHGGFLVMVAVTSAVFLNFSFSLAADGSGTNAVSPNTTTAGLTGQTFPFTFTAAETMDSGEVRIKVPNVGWSTPQGTAGTAGYTTVATSGNATVANVLNAADSATGWTEDDADACNTTPPTNGWGLDTGTSHEGTGSITCNNTGSTGPDAGDSFGYDFTAQNWSAYTQAGFWIRSDTATADGDVQVAIDNATNCGSPIEESNIPALTANTWTYVKWSFAGAGSTRTNVATFCFNAGSNGGMDSKQIWIDDLLVGPGSPTFVANGSDTDIAIRLLDLASTETITTTYGSGGGTSGVTTPAVGGVYTFTTRDRVSDAGGLTAIASSPTITVNNQVPTTSSISPNSKTVGASTFTMTVTGTGFNASSTVNFEGSARTTSFVSSSSITATIPASDMTAPGTFNITVVNGTPGGGTSNAQTFTVNNTVPTTSAISPTSKTVGDAGFTMTVIGTGFNTTSVVNVGASPRTTSFVSSSSITATIPASDMTTAGTYSIIVTNPAPGGGTSNAQTFTVNNPVPTTSSISPDTKTVGDSGFTMTVTGTGFNTNSVINFAGSARTTSFVSSSSVTATIPASDVLYYGTFPITVVNPSPGGGTSNSQTFTVSNPVPTTSSISPDSRTAGEVAFVMTVTGTGFNASSTVNFDNVARTTTFVSSSTVTMIVLTIDQATAGTHSVTVVNPAPGGGTSNAQTLTVNNPIPTTSSVSPDTKIAGQTSFTMTVTGTGFNASSTVNFDGGSRATSFVSSSSVSATILTADLTTAGTHSVTVVNPTPGGGASNAQTFTVNNPVPTTSSISPDTKTVGDSGFTMTVTGTGFNASSTVNFDGGSRTTSFVSSSSITASIPSSDMTTAGTFNITVVNPTPGGGMSNAQTFTVNNAVPTTTSISPDTKTVGDSTFTITVNGTNFGSASVVNFAGSARSTTYASSTQLTASILASDLTSAGTFDITVTNPTPGGGTSNAQTFTVTNATPTTTGISPDTKTAGDSGFTMTVNGTNFVTSSTVKFDGGSRTTTYVSVTQLTVAILDVDIGTAGTHAVTVFNPTPGGGTSNAQTLTVVNPVPTTSSISPTSKTVGNTTFTITVDGTGFNASSTVNFEGSARTTSFVSSSTLTASIVTSDLTTAGTFAITVTNPTPGGGTSNSQTLTVNNPAPTTSLISPSSKAVGASTFTMTVTGTGFTASSVVNFEGSPRATSFVSSSSVTASIPSSDMTTAGTFAITVVNPTPGGGTSNAQTFTVNNASPTTTSISPDAKTVGDSGFTITVNGTNFGSASVVNFAGSARTTTYISSTQLTAAILASDLTTVGTFDITVTNPAPGGGTSNAQTFAVNNPVPTTSSISPNTKTAGDPVFVMTVTGTGFVASSTVQLDGSPRATSFVSSSTVTAFVLTADLVTGGTFAITVVNPTPGGGTSNAQTLTVNNPVPTTSSISPDSKTVGNSTFTMTVTGTGFVSGSVVNFEGSPRTTSFVSSSSVTASIPSSDMTTAGTFNITVTNTTPGGGTSNAQTFTVNNPAPTTSLISPSSKAIGASTFTMTVTGTGFTASSVVNFEGSPRTTSFVSSSSVTASIPSSDMTTAGTFAITVVNPTPGGGTSNSQTFTVGNPAPTTTGISPISRTLGDSGFTLTVNGTGFVSSSVVNFDGSARTTSYVSDTELTAAILASDLAYIGTFAITVTSPTPGGGTSNSQTFTVKHPVPTTTSISPDTKTAGDTGFTLTVNGTGFDASSTVKFDGLARATSFVTSSTVTASILTSDLTTAGTFAITVTNPTPGGGTSNSQTFTVNAVAPVATKFVIIDPVDSTVGVPVTVTVQAQKADNTVDTNYQTDVTLVTDGSATGGGVVAITNGSGTRDVNDSVAETVHLSLSDSEGTGLSVTSTQDVVFANPAPATTSIAPTSATAGDSGFTLTVDGTDFVASSVVRWNGNDRATTYVSSSRLTASIDAADIALAGTASVTVFSPTPGGGTSNAQTFTINNPVPTTTSISPSSKTVGDSGFTLTVNGTNFVTTSKVRWNGSDRVTTYVSPIQVTAAILTSDLTVENTYPITVTNDTPGGGTSNAQTFTVNAAIPVATKFIIENPTDSTVGTPTTVTVKALKADDTVDTAYQTDVTLVTDGSATGGGLVGITNGVGTRDVNDLVAETVNLSLNDSEGTGLYVTSTQDVIFSNPTPTTTGISPSSKVVGDTGFTMTVNGTGFVTSTVAKFDGSARTTTFSSSTELTVAILTSDLTAVGTFPIVVTNATPGGGTSNSQTFTVNAAAPVATKFVITDPADSTVGTPTTVTVRALKADDTVDTAYQTDVTLVASGSATGDGLVDIVNGVGSLDVDDTVAETVDLSLLDSESTSLDISSTQNVVFSAAANPAPILSSISPDTKVAGDQSFVLTVNGSDFVSSSVVKVDGSSRTTTYVSANQLTAVITSADMATYGTLSITVFSPTPGGGTSGSKTLFVNAAPGAELPRISFTSRVHFAGLAYPGAKLTMVGLLGNNVTPMLTSGVADSAGRFDLQFSGLFSGLNSFGLLIEDNSQRVSQTKFYNFDLNLASLTALDIFAPPTVGFLRTAVRKGDVVAVVGDATPGSKVSLQIDGDPIPGDAVALNDGSYQFLYNTAGLDIGRHTARTRQTDQSGRFSDYSPSKAFSVSSLFMPSVDLNGDGKTDIIDWSILLSKWSASDVTSKKALDFNNDGKVDISDFSIFIQNFRTLQ